MNNKISLIISSVSLVGVIYLLGSSNLIGKKKIAYIESQRLLTNYPPVIKLKTDLEVQNSAYKRELEEVMNEMQNEFRNYEAKVGSLSNAEIESEKIRLRGRQNVLEQKSSEIENKAKQNNLAQMTRLTQEINDLIKIYGNEHGYDIILSANGNGNLAYADRGMDITDEVLESLKDKSE